MSLLKKPATSIFVILISAFFVFATTKNNAAGKVPASAVKADSTENTDAANASALFTELHLNEAGLNPTAFNSAIQGLHKLDDKGILHNDEIITIVDFSQPSTQKRLYVLDLQNKRILFNTLVAHGHNSGSLWTKSFSNNASSLKSSPGFYVTEDTYMGSNGYSLRLNGLEKNINDNALNRAIVMHGAPYVDQSAINSLGFLGRSWGCPAVPMSKHKAIINTIKGGTCLFIYSPDKGYQESSTVLNS